MIVTAGPAGQSLRTPRAAAVAGVTFSVLMMAALGIIRLAASHVDSGPGNWSSAVQLAVNLVPFAGVAFLWFLGVLRGRLGGREDKFFASVFLGSGLLFLATLFCAVAVLAATLGSVREGSEPYSETYHVGVRLGTSLLQMFCMKMAAVFTFSTCAIVLRSGFLPRWVALVGIGCGVVLVFVMKNWPWIEMVFPLWVLLVSVRELVVEFRTTKDASSMGV